MTQDHGTSASSRGGRRRPLRIALLSHMCGVNLGDAATQDAMIHNVRRYAPGAQIFGVSLSPDDTEERHGIPTFPLHFQTVPRSLVPTEVERAPAPRQPASSPEEPRRPLRRVLRRLRGCLWTIREELKFALRTFATARSLDLLVVSGGGQLSDEFESIPTKALRWILLAKLAGVRVALVSIGAGPLRTLSNKVASVLLVALADYRSFRDEGARRLTRALGARMSSVVCPDLAHSLPLGVWRTPTPRSAGSPIVAVGPIPYCHPLLWPVRDQAAYDRYVRTLAAFEVWLLERGYSVVHIAGSAGDRYVIADVRAAVLGRASPDSKARLMDEPLPWTVPDLMGRISSAEFVVTSRFHGVVLAHLIGRPTIAMSPHPKVSAVMSDARLTEYDLPIDSLDLDQLQRAFVLLEADRERVGAALRSREEECRRLLDLQYRRLLR